MFVREAKKTDSGRDIEKVREDNEKRDREEEKRDVSSAWLLPRSSWHPNQLHPIHLYNQMLCEWEGVNKRAMQL